MQELACNVRPSVLQTLAESEALGNRRVETAFNWTRIGNSLFVIVCALLPWGVFNWPCWLDFNHYEAHGQLSKPGNCLSQMGGQRRRTALAGDSLDLDDTMAVLKPWQEGVFISYLSPALRISPPIPSIAEPGTCLHIVRIDSFWPPCPLTAT